jgi:hypothetical protein
VKGTVPIFQGTVPIFRLRKTGTVPLLAATFFLSLPTQARDTATPLFTDDFESHAPGEIPGAPWKEETYRSGARVVVDEVRAHSGRRALHVYTPAGARYRRGYVAIHLGQPVPQAQSGMFGRAWIWLDAAPVALPGAGPVHWTLLQGEGRSADDRYNSIYRLGLEQQGGTQLMANFETTPPVTTDCKQQSRLRLPVGTWACVEWHFEVASQELDFWLDGKRVTRVKRGVGAQACRGQDLQAEWRAPPRFDSLYIGFERYADSANDQNLWVDDVVLSKARVGCGNAVK